jgi:hypothetical protein
VSEKCRTVELCRSDLSIAGEVLAVSSSGGASQIAKTGTLLSKLSWQRDAFDDRQDIPTGFSDNL